ncbi:MAG: penicillin-binding transpeptidase domain-containing protein [Myxococcota bacterium]|nr:penicillin-binding transpeptidase domain-containing protein [Myxococcota bacterium]
MSIRGRLTLLGLATIGLGAIAFFWPSDSSRSDGSSRVVENGLGSPLSFFSSDEEVAVSAEPRLLGRLPEWADYEALSANLSADAAPDTPIRNQEDEYVVEYSFDPVLTQRVLRVLNRGRVKNGHVIVLDTQSGRVLAYVSTASEKFPPQGSYPAASLVKVVTAAAGLGHAPDKTRRPCLYTGNQYRLTRSSVHRPKRGHSVSLEHALASSNNRCFAQLAVETLGDEVLMEALERFGWTSSPAPGHAAGELDRGDGEYDLGRLGSGLARTRITPLHAVQLAASLVSGERVEPWWVDRILDAEGRELSLPPRSAPERVMSAETAAELRKMLVRTTTHGTARSAFRDRRGRPRLGDVKVAGKTGNLTGSSPQGRYEWFMGLAPAKNPRVAIVVLQLQSNLWWSKSSELAANLLTEIFCERKVCRADLADRFTGSLGGAVAPVLLSDPMRPSDARVVRR